MSETKGLLEELGRKVTGLLSNLKELKEESEQKTQEIQSLKKELEGKNAAYVQLQKDNEALKQVKPEQDQGELKDKIGEMVKEIDRCISLLKV